MQLLQWTHKYGTDLYLADTPENLEASARLVLQALVDMQYIYEPPDEIDWRYSHIDFELAALTDDQVNELPTQSLKDEANKHRRDYERKVSQHESDREEYDTVLKVIEGEKLFEPDWRRKADSPDGKHKAGDVMPGRQITAWSMLRGRNGGEYEQFELVSVIDPNKE